MSVFYSGPLEFVGYHGCPSKCDLTLYQRGDGRFFAVMTEVGDNPGTSVTNGAAAIATTVLERFQINPVKTPVIWVERYNQDSYTDWGYDEPARHAVVFMGYVPKQPWNGFLDLEGRPILVDFSSPQWRHLPQEEFRRMVKEYLK